MNPNTPVTEIELNSLHCIFLRYSVHTISGHMDSLTYGHTETSIPLASKIFGVGGVKTSTKILLHLRLLPNMKEISVKDMFTAMVN